MEIVKAQESDYPQMVEIYANSHEPFWSIYDEEEKTAFESNRTESVESFMKTSESKEIICAKENGEILGYAVFRLKNPETVWISSLYIDTKHQNKGIGSFLLKSIEKFTKEHEAKVVALETHRNANWAINFYLKNGFYVINDQLDLEPFNKIFNS